MQHCITTHNLICILFHHELSTKSFSHTWRKSKVFSYWDGLETWASGASTVEESVWLLDLVVVTSYAGHMIPAITVVTLHLSDRHRIFTIVRINTNLFAPRSFLKVLWNTKGSNIFFACQFYKLGVCLKFNCQQTHLLSYSNLMHTFLTKVILDRPAGVLQ